MFSAKKAVPIFLLLCLCFPCVMAQTISFAEPDKITHQDVLMYGYNTSLDKWGLIDTYNTTSVGITLPNNTDVQFVLKPQYSSPLEDPAGFLRGLVGWLQTNVLSLLILAAIAGMFIRKW
jgi:hypothetical protein